MGVHLLTFIQIQSTANRVDDPFCPDFRPTPFARLGFGHDYNIQFSAMRYSQKYEEYLLAGVVKPL
jgi:hypothetical protein